MFKSIGEKIDNVMREKREGSEVFDLSFRPDEKEYVNKLIEENEYLMSHDNIAFLQPHETHETHLIVKVIDIRTFIRDFYKNYECFFREESENAIFKYPEDVKDILDKHDYLKPYHNEIIYKRIKNYLNNQKIRGYITLLEDRGDKSFIVKKRFIALYELLFFNKNNKPYVEIKRINKEATLYIPNSKSYVKKDKDTIVCLYKNFERFKDLNDLRDSDFVINKNSIKRFYNFGNIFFVNPTKKWVDLWWGYDCPNLYRFMPNIEGTSNGWGLALDCWQNQLVEYNWNSVYIGEDITEEEVEKFAGDRPHTSVYKQMMAVLNAREMTEEEKKTKIRKAEKIEEEIQKIIDKNKKEILLKTAKRYTTSFDENEKLERASIEELHDYLSDLEKDFCLDCGFLYISLADNRLELFREIAEYDNSRFNSGAMKINPPFNGQSTTIKKEMANHIKEVIERESQYRIKYWTVLD